MGNGVLTKVDAALVHDLLHLEGNKYSQTFRRQGTEGSDLSGAEGKYSIQPVDLLISQHRHLAHALSGSRQDRFRSLIQFLQAVCRDHHRQHRVVHPLISGRQIVQEFLGLSALQIHIVGNHSTEVVVLILSSLPVGDIRLHAQQTVLHVSNGLVRRDGEDVNGKHHVAAKLRQLRHKAVLDIVGVILQIQDPCVAVSDHQVIRLVHDAVRADIVLEVMSLSCRIMNIKGK